MLDTAKSSVAAMRPIEPKDRLRAPLVSVIISNFNYGRFLRSAVESVRAQTYGAIECIVVDDCSTDCSVDVLAHLSSEDPALKIVRLETNGGQSNAALQGLDRASGEFVLFLDSDDVLLADCVSSHLSLHLSSRRAVGFSCCNAFQVTGDDRVQGRWASLSMAFARLAADPSILSPGVAGSLRQAGIELPEIDPEKVRLVPWKNTDWPWTSTSSMFFRRDALRLICGAAGLRRLRIETDSFFAHAINHLTGSLLLDETLVGYRLHGSNNFNKRPALENFICHNRKDERSIQIRRIILDDLMLRFEHYAANMADPAHLFDICRLLDQPDREAGLPRWAARSRFRRHLVEQKKSWRKYFTRGEVLGLVWDKRIPNPWPLRHAGPTAGASIPGASPQ